MSSTQQIEHLPVPVVPNVASRRPGVGVMMLLAGSICVGAAIMLDGLAGRVVNGIGAASWVTSAGVLIWCLRRTPGFGRRMVLAAVLAIGIAAVVRPNDLIAALVGFSIVGGVMAAFGGAMPVPWAALVAALYLPAHVVIAISRSMLRGEIQVRVDPPPTAPIVPLVIVAAALLGGAAVRWWKRRAT